MVEDFLKSEILIASQFISQGFLFNFTLENTNPQVQYLFLCVLIEILVHLYVLSVHVVIFSTGKYCRKLIAHWQHQATELYEI